MTDESLVADVDGVSVPTGHLIGGVWVDSPTTFESRSPLGWDDMLLANIARGDAGTAAAAVGAAVEGFTTWSRYSPTERAEVLHRLANGRMLGR